MNGAVCFHEKRLEVVMKCWSNTKRHHFLSDEEATEMRELTQLRREIELSMLAKELISATE